MKRNGFHVDALRDAFSFARLHVSRIGGCETISIETSECEITGTGRRWCAETHYLERAS